MLGPDKEMEDAELGPTVATQDIKRILQNVSNVGSGVSDEK